MKKLNKYRKELTDEKERIVALYGVDITKSLFHEYYGTLHSMDMKEEYLNSFQDQNLLDLETSIAQENSIDEQTLQNYEKELASDSDPTN